MAGYAWTNEEEAVTVYYASIGVQHYVIAQLLAQRYFTRTPVAVRNKVQEIQRRQGRLFKHMMKSETDQLIGELSTILEIEALLIPTPEDQDIVNRSQKNIDLREKYKEWRIRGAIHFKQ